MKKNVLEGVWGLEGVTWTLLVRPLKKSLVFFVCLPFSEYIAAINSPTHSIH